MENLGTEGAPRGNGPSLKIWLYRGHNRMVVAQPTVGMVGMHVGAQA